MDSVVFCPEVGTSLGATAGRGSGPVERRLHCGRSPGSEGPRMEPSLESSIASWRPDVPHGLRVLCQTQKKGHTSPDVYRPDCQPHTRSHLQPWPREHARDEGPSFQSCPAQGKTHKTPEGGQLKDLPRGPFSRLLLTLKKGHDAVPTKRISCAWICERDPGRGGRQV